MTKEERKAKIQEIYHGTPVGTGTKLTYQGQTRDFDVYKIPLDLLVYNVENGRISSLVKSYKTSHGEIEAVDDSAVIERFLYSSSPERNNSTEEDLVKHGQLEPGIITMDGVIIDGNRRASLLNRIRKNDSYDQVTRDRCGYFLTRILPEDADQKEILRLETTYQMGTDSKVDYNPIEKYLHIKDLKEAGFSLTQIAEYMGLKSKNEVTSDLAILELMDDYLKTYDYDGIYTRLPRGCEDDFIKLHASIERVQSGRISWIPSTEVEEQIINLKGICYAFIRLGLKQGFDYRAIAYTSNANFLNDEQTWKKFVDRHFEATDDIEEKSIDETLSTAETDDDMEHLLKQRDELWKDKVSDALEDNYIEAKNRIENKKEKSKPITLARKALNALIEIDYSLINEGQDKVEFQQKIKEIQEQLNILKEAITE